MPELKRYVCATRPFLQGTISKKFIQQVMQDCERYGMDNTLIEIKLIGIQEIHLLEQEKTLPLSQGE